MGEGERVRVRVRVGGWVRVGEGGLMGTKFSLTLTPHPHPHYTHPQDSTLYTDNKCFSTDHNFVFY